jgi:ATP-dependent helicase/nuclease subunit B
VTEIENWLRDPYTIYARHILKLRELPAVDLPPGAADRGTVIHSALSEFTREFAAGLPADPAQTLIDIGAKHFAALADYPEARAFWWPRFKRIARWLAGWESARRSSVAALSAEIAGKIDIPLGERVLSLRARADRIERLADGDYAILDYKTGQVPSEKQVRIGVSPQLTLEAAILRHGGFPEIPSGASVAELVYVSLKGGDPAGEDRLIDFKDGNADAHAERALAKLRAVAERFEDEQQPYLPLVLPMWKSRYGPYDHLARIKEWAVGGTDETEAGEGAGKQDRCLLLRDEEKRLITATGEGRPSFLPRRLFGRRPSYRLRRARCISLTTCRRLAKRVGSAASSDIATGRRRWIGMASACAIF